MGKNNSNEHWIQFLGSLNEVQVRQLAGLKAIEFGWGGISKVGKLTDMDYKTIKKRGCLKLKAENLLKNQKAS